MLAAELEQQELLRQQTNTGTLYDVLQNGIDDECMIEDMRDIQDSLATVLRRSEGLTRFIQSYRQLSRLPPPKAGDR